MVQPVVHGAEVAGQYGGAHGELRALLAGDVLGENLVLLFGLGVHGVKQAVGKHQTLGVEQLYIRAHALYAVQIPQGAGVGVAGGEEYRVWRQAGEHLHGVVHGKGVAAAVVYLQVARRQVQGEQKGARGQQAHGG